MNGSRSPATSSALTRWRSAITSARVAGEVQLLAHRLPDLERAGAQDRRHVAGAHGDDRPRGLALGDAHRLAQLALR